jgi:hypothetical protein
MRNRIRFLEGTASSAENHDEGSGDLFYGCDETYVCLLCASRCAKLKAKESEVPTVKKDRENAEWLWKLRGFGVVRPRGGSSRINAWLEDGAAVQRLLLLSGRAGHGEAEERPPEEWLVT